jgi:hypothetical protein
VALQPPLTGASPTRRRTGGIQQNQVSRTAASPRIYKTGGGVVFYAEGQVGRAVPRAPLSDQRSMPFTSRVLKSTGRRRRVG